MTATATILEFERYRLHAFQRQASRLPWFVLAEVCEVLALDNPSYVAQRLDNDEKGLVKDYTLGGSQQVLAVSLSGLTRLAGTSRKPIAKRFNKWLHSDVVVSIFLTGEFKGDTTPLDQLIGSFQPALKLDEAPAQKHDNVVHVDWRQQELFSEPDDRKYLERNVGKPLLLWAEHIDKDFKLCGVPWGKLPLEIRRIWWHQTNYNRLPPPPGLAEKLARIFRNMARDKIWSLSADGPDYERDSERDIESNIPQPGEK